jgi:hypothetical protein
MWAYTSFIVHSGPLPHEGAIVYMYPITYVGIRAHDGFALHYNTRTYLGFGSYVSGWVDHRR